MMFFAWSFDYSIFKLWIIFSEEDYWFELCWFKKYSKDETQCLSIMNSIKEKIIEKLYKNASSDNVLKEFFFISFWNV